MRRATKKDLDIIKLLDLQPHFSYFNVLDNNSITDSFLRPERKQFLLDNYNVVIKNNNIHEYYLI